MNDKVREAIFKQVEIEPFARKFGLELLDLDNGYPKMEMKFTSDMENIFGLAHGGARCLMNRTILSFLGSP